MAKIFFTILFLIVHNAVVAQQCGYYPYYVFAVNPHLPNSNKKIERLKMYLVDENNQVITNTKTILVNKSWEQVRDSFFFWDNSKIINIEYTKPFIRRNFYRVGDKYLVAFQLKTHLLKDPLEHPMYKLKVEEQTINNVIIREQYFYLPVKKAISICSEHLYSDFDGYPPIKTLDNKAFEPIDIVLNQEQQAEVGEEKNSLKYAVRFDYYELKETAEEGAKAYTITGAKIFNTQSGKVQQVLNILSQSKSVIKESKRIVEFTDFYNRGIEEAKDFSVQIDNWRDLKNMVVREKTNFYIFNPSKKLYELDTALSNYDDVFYYLPLKTMRRYEYAITEKSKIKYMYQLENKQWKLIDTQEEYLPQYQYKKPKQRTPFNCIVVPEKWHTKPIQSLNENNKTRELKDTFWIYNTCPDTIKIIDIKSNYRDAFTITQTLLPNSKVPLVFKGAVYSAGIIFNTISNTCSITLEDKTVHNFSVEVPILIKECEVYFNVDSTIKYAIENKPNLTFNKAYLANNDGSLRTTGYVKNKDTTLKCGAWNYYTDKTLTEIIYSKEMLLRNMPMPNDYSQRTKLAFKIKVFEEGIWKSVDFDKSHDRLRFFYTDKIDSVLAYTDSTNYSLGFNYNKMPNTVSLDFYLLKPNQNRLKLNGYTIPFTLLNNTYAFVLDYNKAKVVNRTTEQILDSIVGTYIRKFPKLGLFYVNKHLNAISLDGLNDIEKNRVLQYIKSDTSIATACTVFSFYENNRYTFCNKQVYVQVMPNDIENFKTEIKKLGFTYQHPDIGSYNHLINYNNKMLDESFFEAYKVMSNLPYVITTSLNTYGVAEPDIDVHRF